MTSSPSLPLASLSTAEARRIALAAQGFGGRRGASISRWPQIDAAVARMGLLQLDSVNVLVRSHYLPVYSRIGAYSRTTLDTNAFGPGPKRSFFEYWAHEASLLPLAFQPLMRWRMRRAEAGQGIYSGVHNFAVENSGYVAATLAEIERRGPISASELDEPGERSGPWWGWHKGKIALEYLFWIGAVTTAHRRGFERVYNLSERVFPAEILALPTPADSDAIRDLAEFGAKALGVATEQDIRDYFRLPVLETKKALAELVEAKQLSPVAVEGWNQPAFLDPAAVLPVRLVPTALLSPFDPLVWNRPRTERLFDFRYRLEFYTPGPKRTFGYFVMPFLHRGRLEARIDLKADRAEKTLSVLGVFPEEKIRQPDGLLEGLAEELRHLAAWLGLAEIRVRSEAPIAENLRQKLKSTATE